MNPRRWQRPGAHQGHQSGTRAARLAWLRSGVSCGANLAAGYLRYLSPGGYLPAHRDLAVGSVARFRAFVQSLPLGSRARRSSRSARSPRESCSFARSLKAGARSALPASSRVAWFPASPCMPAGPASGRDGVIVGLDACGTGVCDTDPCDAAAVCDALTVCDAAGGMIALGGSLTRGTAVPVTPYASA